MLFPSAVSRVLDGSLSGEKLAMLLLADDAVPDPDWRRYRDVRGELRSGRGYESGGSLLDAPRIRSYSGEDFPAHWKALTSYEEGAVIRTEPASRRLYRASLAGHTGLLGNVLSGRAPARGQTIEDGSVLWSYVGDSLVSLTSDAASWPHASFASAWALLYEDDGDRPLLGALSLGGVQAAQAKTFIVEPDRVLGWLWLAI